MKPSVKKKVLYFIKDLYPSEEEMKAAGALGTLTFRSIQSFSPSDFIEPCDGVAGCAPEAYVAKFGRVDKVPEKVEEKVPPPPPPPSQPAAPPPPPNPFQRK